MKVAVTEAAGRAGAAETAVSSPSAELRHNRSLAVAAQNGRFRLQPVNSAATVRSG
jgi:hypothetical protein